MSEKELLSAALDYMKTKAGSKALGIELDVNQFKSLTQSAKDPQTREAIKDKLKSYIPEMREFKKVKGRLYDKTTSQPLEGVKVETLLAKGKKTFTDKNGEFEIDFKLPILPYNNKALLEAKLVFTKKKYVPAYSELLTQQRQVKTDLKAKPLINIKLEAKEAINDLKRQVYKKIEEASKLALAIPEKILLVRRKAIERFTNTLLFKLLPLAISLLLIFGITKIKDRGKKICPTPDQLARAIKTRNSIARQLNQIYGMLALNIALAIIFNYIAIQLKGIRIQISSLSFPTSVPPGAGVPYSLISSLENIKELLKELSENNKQLNIQLIIALIFFVVAMIILAMILKTVDSLIFECARDENITLEELNPAIQDLTKETEDNIVTPNNINGFTIEVIELDKNQVEDYKRKQAVGKNSQGVILVRGDESFSSSDTVLKNELIFYIKSNDLKAY